MKYCTNNTVEMPKAAIEDFKTIGHTVATIFSIEILSWVFNNQIVVLFGYTLINLIFKPSCSLQGDEVQVLQL